MEHQLSGNTVELHGDHARISFDIPLGEDIDRFFENAKKDYQNQLVAQIAKMQRALKLSDRPN